MKLKLTELIFDFALYPRGDVDNGHVAHIVEAIEAGSEIPPILIDAKSKRIVDGFHRARAWRRHLGDDGEIIVAAKHYKNERELYREAMTLNASHGRNLTSYDRTIAIEKGLGLGLEPGEIASAMNMTLEKVTSFKLTRCCKLENSRRMVPLKLPIRHMAGQTLTKQQAGIVPKLGGNHALFYVHQLKMIIEHHMLDMSNEALLKELANLAEAIQGLKAGKN